MSTPLVPSTSERLDFICVTRAGAVVPVSISDSGSKGGLAFTSKKIPECECIPPPLFDIFSHTAFFQHFIVGDAEREIVDKKHGIAFIPRIIKTDAPVRWIGAKVGDVIRIHRGKSVFVYRLVADIM